MSALTKQPALVNYAERMVVSSARSMAAPPTRWQEACASCMVQTARVKQSIAAQMQKRGAGIVGSTGEEVASAKQSHPATLLLFRASLSAPCTAPTGSAPCGGAAKMPTKVEEGCATRTTLKCYALLQTAPTKLLHGGFAGSTVRMGSAQRQGVLHLLEAAGSAASTVPMGSAQLQGVLQLLLSVGSVISTARVGSARLAIARLLQ